jgi:hypothetical protein
MHASFARLRAGKAVALAAGATLLLLLISLISFPGAAHADGVGGTISGTLAGHFGPLADDLQLGNVEVDDADGNSVAGVGLQDDGSWSVQGLPDGTYFVLLSAQPQGSTRAYYSQYWGGSTSIADAAAITITSADTVSDIDVVLDAEPQVTGVVTAPDGTALANVGVELLQGDDTNILAYTTTDDGGSYAINAPAPGTYTEKFISPDSTTYADSYRGTSATTPASSFAAAASITATNNVTQALDQTLPLTATITGTVTNATTHAPVANVTVTATNADNSAAFSATTGANGQYIIKGVLPDSYIVNYSVNGYQAQWFPAVHFGQDATVIKVLPNASLSVARTYAASTALVPAGSIAGTVSGPDGGVANIYVSVIDHNGDTAASGWTQDDGTYDIQSIPNGTYTVTFDPQGQNFIAKPYSTTGTTATSIALSASHEDYTGINTTLAVAGEISGTVNSFDPDYTGAVVELFKGGVSQNYTVVSNPGDGYSFTGLASGTYTVEFEPTTTTENFEWWNGTTEAHATPIIVTAGEISDGIDESVLPGVVAGTTTVHTPGADHTSVGEIASVVTTSAPSPSGAIASYQWMRGSGAITGATASSYKLVNADAGHYLSVVVTLSAEGHSATSTQYYVGPIVAGAVFTTVPTTTITGTLKAGSTLTAHTGAFVPAATHISYLWEMNEIPISGAHASTYKLNSGNVGQRIRVIVSATRAYYNGKESTVEVTVPYHLFTKTGTPTISGTVAVGHKLTAKPGTWAPSGITFHYQWLLNGVAISKATASTFTVVTADKGKSLSVRVTGTKSLYGTVVKTSAAHKVP